MLHCAYRHPKLSGPQETPDFTELLTLVQWIKSSLEDGRKELIAVADGYRESKLACDEFLGLYGAKYPKACECLSRDKEVLFSFYNFPAEYWSHIRSTNPIESTFATVRHRTRRAKGCGSRTATLMMVFKLTTAAEKKWRRINAANILGKVGAGVVFVDGEEPKPQQLAA